MAFRLSSAVLLAALVAAPAFAAPTTTTKVDIAAFDPDKDGTVDLKILPECTLPLTGVGVVNLVITDLGVMEVGPGGLKLLELAPGVTREDVVAATGVTVN